MSKKHKHKDPQSLSTRKLESIVRSGEDFFDKEYVAYCMYVLEQRALPSIIDGLKPGARKVIHAAFSILSESKKSSFLDVVGTTISKSKYHHGDASLLGTIKTLGTEYADNLAPLKIIGSNGDLKSPESAAPRYLSARLSRYAKLLKQNANILEYNYDGAIQVEPKYYLPIIPLVLTSRTTGLGVGFSFSLKCSYNPVSLVDQCLSILRTGEMSGPLVPHIRQWTGSFTKLQKGTVYAKGRYTLNNKTLVVNEFSPNTTFEDFEIQLNRLYDQGKIIKFDNNSADDVEYVITLSSEYASKLTESKLERDFCLGETLKRPTLNILDENGKLTEFDTVESIVEYFVEFRRQKYHTLKAVQISDLKKQLQDYENLSKFIELYMSGVIKFDKDTPLQETIGTIKSHNLPEELVDTRMSKLTKDEQQKLQQKISETKQQIQKIESTHPDDMYIADLVDLRAELEEEFLPFAPYNEQN